MYKHFFDILLSFLWGPYQEVVLLQRIIILNHTDPYPLVDNMMFGVSEVVMISFINLMESKATWKPASRNAQEGLTDMEMPVLLMGGTIP